MKVILFISEVEMNDLPGHPADIERLAYEQNPKIVLDSGAELSLNSLEVVVVDA